MEPVLACGPLHPPATTTSKTNAAIITRLRCDAPTFVPRSSSALNTPKTTTTTTATSDTTAATSDTTRTTPPPAFRLPCNLYLGKAGGAGGGCFRGDGACPFVHSDKVAKRNQRLLLVLQAQASGHPSPSPPPLCCSFPIRDTTRKTQPRHNHACVAIAIIYGASVADMKHILGCSPHNQSGNIDNPISSWSYVFPNEPRVQFSIVGGGGCDLSSSSSSSEEDQCYCDQPTSSQSTWQVIVRRGTDLITHERCILAFLEDKQHGILVFLPTGKPSSAVMEADLRIPNCALLSRTSLDQRLAVAHEIQATGGMGNKMTKKKHKAGGGGGALAVLDVRSKEVQQALIAVANAAATHHEEDEEEEVVVQEADTDFILRKMQRSQRTAHYAGVFQSLSYPTSISSSSTTPILIFINETDRTDLVRSLSSSSNHRTSSSPPPVRLLCSLARFSSAVTVPLSEQSMRLISGGRAGMDQSRAGAAGCNHASALSEAASCEVLSQLLAMTGSNNEEMQQLQLTHTEMEMTYIQSARVSRLDYRAAVLPLGNIISTTHPLHVGVSVTRALVRSSSSSSCNSIQHRNHCEEEEEAEMYHDFALRLVRRKCQGLRNSLANVDPSQAWDHSFLHIWVPDTRMAAAVCAAVTEIIPSLSSSFSHPLTILVTLAQFPCPPLYAPIFHMGLGD